MSQKSHGPSPASQTSSYVLALSERFLGLIFELQLRAILRDDAWERGDGSGRTASKANGNERGAATCMCTAGVWGRSGEEASRTEQSRRETPLPRQHEPPLTKGAYSFLLILVVLFHTTLQGFFCVVFVLCIRWYVQFSIVSLVPEKFKSIFRFSRHV